MANGKGSPFDFGHPLVEFSLLGKLVTITIFEMTLD